MTKQTASGWSARVAVLPGLTALTLLFTGFGLWAATMNISGAVVTTGQLEVEQNRRVVQHPTGGVVAEVVVTDGSFVGAGDMLLRFDTTELRGKIALYEIQYIELQASIDRLQAEFAGAEGIEPDRRFVATYRRNADFDRVTAAQEVQFAVRQNSRLQRKRLMHQQEVRIAAQIEGAQTALAATHRQIALVVLQLNQQQALLDRGLAHKRSVLRLQQEEAGLLAEQGRLRASQAVSEAELGEVRLRFEAQVDDSREKNLTELAELQQKRTGIAAGLLNLEYQLAAQDVRAPVSGIVHGLTINTPRSVVRAADTILYLVPQDQPLVATVRVDPGDVNKVTMGQDVTVRLAARVPDDTGELTGYVTRISADVIVEGRQEVRFYEVEISLPGTEGGLLPGGQKLLPGLSVEALIRTGNRTALAYLLKPVTDYFARAFRES